jgi:predicted Zn-dependent protease with MMP-like domain
VGAPCPTADYQDSARATGADPGSRKEVPVFFSPAKDEKSFAYLGVFEGYSLIDGPPSQPDEMPRITLFIDTLVQTANYRRTVFLREVRIIYLHELGHYFAWDEGQIANVGLA